MINSVLETSPYETEMYKTVQKTLEEAISDTSLKEQILIGVMINSMDADFKDSGYVKVKIS